jgi:hypothetical protein
MDLLEHPFHNLHCAPKRPGLGKLIVALFNSLQNAGLNIANQIASYITITSQEATEQSQIGSTITKFRIENLKLSVNMILIPLGKLKKKNMTLIIPCKDNA